MNNNAEAAQLIEHWKSHAIYAGELAEQLAAAVAAAEQRGREAERGRCAALVAELFTEWARDTGPNDDWLTDGFRKTIANIRTPDDEAAQNA